MEMPTERQHYDFAGNMMTEKPNREREKEKEETLDAFISAVEHNGKKKKRDTVVKVLKSSTVNNGASSTPTPHSTIQAIVIDQSF